MRDNDRQDYQAYMVRLWRIEGDEGPVWHASVESPHTSERHAFADLELLIAFLRDRTANVRTQQMGWPCGGGPPEEDVVG